MADSRLRHSGYDSIDSDDPDYRDLLALFLEVLPKERAELQKTFSNQRWAELSRKAHQLKGMADAFGFPALSEKAEALETACQAEDAGIPQAFKEMLSAFDRVLST